MKNERKIFITEFDKTRLTDLMDGVHEYRVGNREDLSELAAELDRARLVEPKKVPADVVTMNSKVVLVDMTTSERDTYTLAFPNEADADTGAISILAPIGTAILGYRVGDVVEWKVPGGTRKLKIERLVYQPEAAGDYDR
jgi:regulator of nucleoside diphosphate kinase